MQGEAFSRAVIDGQLKDRGWPLTDGHSVRFEYALGDGTRADYLLCSREGRGLAVIEAKRSSVNAGDAREQARKYAQLAQVPFIFLANGKEMQFWDWQHEAHPHPVHTFFSQEDLERRAASRNLRTDPFGFPIDRRIVERPYQHECIDALCREINLKRRKLLVEMATGAGKTRTAAALIKRLFQANVVTRVLFLVDRIPLALQTEDAFSEHLRDYPCYTLRAGRRFQDEKRITVTTLQSMINLYHDYSSGYFDLIITDECHRSIYGKWRKVLEHFDGIQIGLTATPCVHTPSEGDDEDKLFVRDTLRFFELDKPTYTYKLKQAIEDGYLVGYQTYKAQTVKTAAEDGFPVKRSEIAWDGLEERTRAELEEAFAKAASGQPPKDHITVDPSALERKFTIPERNRAIVREFHEVMEKGYPDPKTRTQRKPLLGKTIVFAVTKRHAETLAKMLDQQYAHLKPSPNVLYADYVVSGTGADDTVDGIARIRAFRKEKFPKAPQILVSVNMLDTGFDCPDVVNLVFARFTKSAILYRQMIGRGTRKAQGKPLFTLFDFVGVTKHFGDDDDYGEGGAIKEPPPRKYAGPRTLVTVNADDWIDPATREWISYDDEGRVVFLEPEQAKAAELGARFEGWLLSKTFTPDQERWLYRMEEQIHSNAGFYEDFTLDHLEQPPFTGLGGRRKAAEVFGNDERLARVIGDLRKAVFNGPTH